MLEMKLKTVIEIMQGKVCHGDINKYGEHIITNICYDSRQVNAGSVFMPIVGEKVDAHKFIPQVLSTDCCASLSEKDDIELPTDQSDKILIKVESSLEAVRLLAEEFRKSIKVPVVGITGSVGKTTTREMITLALSAGKKVYATPGNKNSQIGTPETIFGFDKDAEICVFEMGMSMPGEMNKLASMVRPDVAVFTNIGVTHIENLGSREAILEEKLHITDFMDDDSTVFVNNDNDLLKNLQLRNGLIKYTYGLTNDCDAYAEDVDLNSGCPSFTAVIKGKKVDVKLNSYGTHQIYNALVALAVADHYGVDIDKAALKLGEFRGYSHRQQIFNNKYVTVIDDTYNAAPDSMKAALDMLRSINCKGRRIAVLADMKELGDVAIEAHIEIGKYAAQNNVDILITYGDMAKYIDKGFMGRESIHVDTENQLEEMLSKTIKANDLILLKGSNSMKLFNFVDKVLEYEFM